MIDVEIFRTMLALTVYADDPSRPFIVPINKPLHSDSAPLLKCANMLGLYLSAKAAYAHRIDPWDRTVFYYQKRHGQAALDLIADNHELYLSNFVGAFEVCM